jgi:integral membrane protein
MAGCVSLPTKTNTTPDLVEIVHSSLKHFRIIALSEGVSFLVLLFVAMPLKYLADKPMAVKYVGWVHGGLFVLYVLLGLRAAKSEGWTFKFCVVAFVASLLPFGTFVLDRKLRLNVHPKP